MFSLLSRMNSLLNDGLLETIRFNYESVDYTPFLVLILNVKFPILQKIVN